MRWIRNHLKKQSMAMLARQMMQDGNEDASLGLTLWHIFCLAVSDEAPSLTRPSEGQRWRCECLVG